MSKYISAVIMYKDSEKQPSFHANMEVLGGKVTAVMFDDALKKLEDTEEELDKALSKLGRLKNKTAYVMDQKFRVSISEQI